MSSLETPESELGGGASHHPGYTVVGSISEDDIEGDSFPFSDLLPQVRLHQIPGISMSLSQPQQNSSHGTILIRIIHDNKMRVFLFRKDEDGVSNFKISVGHNVD